MEVVKKEKLTYTQLILMLLANSTTHCLTFSELKEKMGLSDSMLWVYLHRLSKRGIVSAKWKKSNGKRERIYCLKLRDLE